jgi:hypothetical protein
MRIYSYRYVNKVFTTHIMRTQQLVSRNMAHIGCVVMKVFELNALRSTSLYEKLNDPKLFIVSTFRL